MRSMPKLLSGYRGPYVPREPSPAAIPSLAHQYPQNVAVETLESLLLEAVKRSPGLVGRDIADEIGMSFGQPLRRVLHCLESLTKRGLLHATRSPRLYFPPELKDFAS